MAKTEAGTIRPFHVNFPVTELTDMLGRGENNLRERALQFPLSIPTTISFLMAARYGIAFTRSPRRMSEFRSCCWYRMPRAARNCEYSMPWPPPLTGEN